MHNKILKFSNIFMGEKNVAKEKKKNTNALPFLSLKRKQRAVIFHGRVDSKTTRNKVAW